MNMTPEQWKAAVAELEALWPLAPQWPLDTIKQTYRLAEKYDFLDVKEAIGEWFESGNQWPPQPAQLLKAVREISYRRPTPQLETPKGNLISLADWLKGKGYDTIDDYLRAAQ